MAIIMVSHDLNDHLMSNRSSAVNHVHRHNSETSSHPSNCTTHCPIQIVSHGTVPHTVLEEHAD
ncbi:MAG: hypothetical protein ACLR8Y_18815 [Alistipes indistinctus]